MMKHGAHWKQMSHAQRQKYDKQAELARAMKEHATEEALQSKLDEVNVLQAQHADVAKLAGSSTMTYSSSRLPVDVFM
eukprot:3563202-Amphidinium_carterae.1